MELLDLFPLVTFADWGTIVPSSYSVEARRVVFPPVLAVRVIYLTKGWRKGLTF